MLILNSELVNKNVWFDPLLGTIHSIQCLNASTLLEKAHQYMRVIECSAGGVNIIFSCHNNSCYYFISILWIVELNPYAAHVYFNRANLYASLRKYKDSEDDYTRGKSQPHLPPLPSRVPLSFHLTWYGAVLPLESNWKLERSIVVQAVIKC